MPDFSEDELTELSLLRGLEIDALVEHNLLSKSSRFDSALLSTIPLIYPEITISIQTGPKYPATQLEVEFENVSLPRLVMDGLRIECRKIVVSEGEENCVEKWKKRDENGGLDGFFEGKMTALHVAMKCWENLQRFRESLRRGEMLDTGSSIDEALVIKGIKNSHISERVDVCSIPVDATASSVLRKLPEEICALIPASFRILHVESVIRQDLFAKFKKCQESICKDLQTRSWSSLLKLVPQKMKMGMNTAEDAATYLATPRLTFHGTSNRFVPSIVRYGFLAPGTEHPETHTPLAVRCGSTYGQGIYSSPSAEFSLSYSGTEAQPTTTDGFWGMKLLVCATVMGISAQMTRVDDWRVQSKPIEGAHSHVANCENEYIVFDNAQILPCYVVHLDWGADNAQFFSKVEQDRRKFVTQSKPHSYLIWSRLEGPGDLQRKKETLIAKAAKYFPYGYGPASGTRFVVEEVGEIDDDEEEYGEYQREKVDRTRENRDIWEWEDVEENKEVMIRSKLVEYRIFVEGRKLVIN